MGLKAIKGGIFSDSIGWGKNWCLKKTRSNDTFLDKVVDQLKILYPFIKIKRFGDPYGNDELIFDSIQTGIPAISIYKYPFPEYHTNNDTPGKIQEQNLNQAQRFVFKILEILEGDKIYKFVHSTPFWMSKYGVYADDQYMPIEFKNNFQIVYELLDGKNSILDIANKLNAKFSDIQKYLSKLQSFNLVRELRYK